jgi:hypothetical protein
MDKRVIAIITVIMLAIGGGVTYLVTRPDAEPAEQETNQQETAEQPSVVVADGLTGGTYTDYEDGIVAKITGTKLLFFHASGSTLSLTLDADIKKQDIPQGVTIIKVDYDTNQQLREQYSVTSPATVVKVYDNGQTAKTFVVQNDPTLSAVLGYLL